MDLFLQLRMLTVVLGWAEVHKIIYSVLVLQQVYLFVYFIVIATIPYLKTSRYLTVMRRIYEIKSKSMAKSIAASLSFNRTE